MRELTVEEEAFLRRERQRQGLATPAATTPPRRGLLRRPLFYAVLLLLVGGGLAVTLLAITLRLETLVGPDLLRLLMRDSTKVEGALRGVDLGGVQDYLVLYEHRTLIIGTLAGATALGAFALTLWDFTLERKHHE